MSEELREENELMTISQGNALEVKQYKSMWNDKEMLATNWNAATYLAKSQLVPELYQSNPQNCLVALDMANRTGYSPLMVMQQMIIVKGKPAWSGQMSIGLVNGSGRFAEPLKFTFVGEENTMSYGCYASTKNHKGEEIKGTVITMQMAMDEGWLDKSGSKWKTMPTQMLQYRAGAFFARIHCPDVLLGMQTIEEVNDVYGYEEQKQTVKITL